ncbi:MAG: DNA methyltransferase [Chloroflexi bacterium]|nr:DNA methyltransferase [Chloroflexota bacterium]
MGTSNWANRTIFTGDNLDIMRGMNSESVDLIYLDPPFNSNKNYAAPVGSKAAGAAFKDTWTLSDLDVAWMGLIADQEPAIYKLLEAARLTHGKGMQSYLCMMAIRLLEMRRVLRKAGSIYLHCDTTASHYLKMLMDATFGAKLYKAEINWQRTTAHSDSRTFGNVCDRILFYGASPINADAIRTPLAASYVKSHYSFEDLRGRYRTDNLTGPGLSAGESGQIWRNYDPSNIGRCWSAPKSGKYAEWIDENVIPGYLEIESVLARLDALEEADMLIHATKGAVPQLKRYLDASPGQVPSNNWTDISAVNSQAKERIGFPTQKPLKLLERVILASSKLGDVVLDPFAGCATACVAAESLGRQWVGIDLSPKAVELVNFRLKSALGSLYHYGFVTSREDIPKRTDVDAPIHYRQNKHVLFGRQEGVCNGCKMDFPFKIFDVDHVVPQSRGGTDHIDNLQLLCSSCNRIKGDRPMEYLVSKLTQLKEGVAFR